MLEFMTMNEQFQIYIVQDSLVSKISAPGLGNHDQKTRGVLPTLGTPSPKPS